jgi:hypothetical protein
MISVEVFIGALVSIITLLGGAGGILFRHIVKQGETIARLHESSLKDALTDRDFYRDRLFDITRTAEISASNTRRAMDRSSEYPGRS